MTYSKIQAQERAALRTAILDAASRLLVMGGWEALSLRKLAHEVGCSTTVIYTLFGNKQGVIDALLDEGFDRLWQSEQEALAVPDPLDRLGALGMSYRDAAIANPDYYRVMFERVFPATGTGAGSPKRTRPAFQVLVSAVAACIEAGVFRPGDAEEIATVLWATVHGVVSLELAGELGEAVVALSTFRTALQAVAIGFLMTSPTLS